MRFRSLTKHIREQNWFAVALDFFIVVVGILMAFQISNWNAARQEQASQELIHQRLLQDFELIENQNDRAVKYIENQMDSLIVLQKAVTRGRVNEGEDERIKDVLQYWVGYPTFNQRSGTYVEIESSGRLDLIESEPLRIELTQYDRWVQQSRYNETRIFEMLSQNIDFLDASQYRTMALPSRNDKGEFVRGPITGYDIKLMAADPEFRRLLLALIELKTWLVANVYDQRRALGRVKEVLDETK